MADYPNRVGEAYGIDGCEYAAWVIPKTTFTGRVRWKFQIERHFVKWSVFHQTMYRFRTFDSAKKAALKMLHRVDQNGGRG